MSTEYLQGMPDSQRKRQTSPGVWPNAISWTARGGVALILAQTLFFKFTYAPETQVIFADRGGRAAATAVGLVELLCVVLLLVPRTAAAGAVLSLVVISGALFTHLTSLGIQVVNPATGEGDGGLLFALAVLVALGSVIVLACARRKPSGFKSSRLRASPTAPGVHQQS